MILLALLAVLLAAALVLGVRGVRKHRTPAELRGDWWSRFESDFRSYAVRGSQPRGPARWYRRDDRRPSQGGGR